MLRHLNDKPHFRPFAAMTIVIILLILLGFDYPINADDEIIDEEFIIPDGGGEVIEYVEDMVTRREFYTIKTEKGNVFYLIIDNEKSGGNVYFLNDVDESDLIEFVKDKSETTSVREASVPVPEVNPLTETPVEEAPSTIETEKETNKAPLLMGLVFLAVAGGGAYWYFRIRKAKPISGIISSDDDEYDELYSETVINEDNDDEEE